MTIPKPHEIWTEVGPSTEHIFYRQKNMFTNKQKLTPREPTEPFHNKD